MILSRCYYKSSITVFSKLHYIKILESIFTSQNYTTERKISYYFVNIKKSFCDKKCLSKHLFLVIIYQCLLNSLDLSDNDREAD